jgi:hypothetical protein
MIALFLASLDTDRVWQILFTVGVVIGLLYAFLGACAAAEDILRHPPWRDRTFWMVNVGLVLLYASTFVLVYLAAAARLTFTAENRSTALRVTMLVQQGLFLGWLAYAWGQEIQQTGRMLFNFRFIAMIVLLWMPIPAIYWFCVGALMSGENQELSQRVRRTLPQSLMGRAFKTWFFPGPETGYIFAVASLASIAALVWILALFLIENGPRYQAVSLFCLTCVSYVAVYLGIGNILLYLIRRISSVTLFTAAVIQCLLVLIGTAAPYLIAEFNRSYGRSYSLLHVTNPFWSCIELLEDPNSIVSAHAIPWLVVPPAIVIFFINLWLVAPRVREQAVAKPLRMVEEDAALAPPPAAPPPASPWD